jgi:hypothetical protein
MKNIKVDSHEGCDGWELTREERGGERERERERGASDKEKDHQDKED